MKSANGVQWTAIVLTCQTKDSAYAFQQELEIRQKRGVIPPDVTVLTVEDPATPVGSGSATLNALLVITEHLCNRRNQTMVTGDVLQDVQILIFHMGRNFPMDACGRAFAAFPMQQDHELYGDGLVCNIDILLYQMTHQVAVNVGPGIWVASTDAVLDFPSAIDGASFQTEDVVLIAVPGTVDYATHHGVAKIGPGGYLEDILYQADPITVQSCADGDKVPVVCGLSFMSPKMAAKLLSLHVLSPLDACTYLGLDSGAKPIELSLFFDFLLAMSSAVSESDFVTGKRSGPYGGGKTIEGSQEDVTRMKNARALLWRELRAYKVKVEYVKDGTHSYMTMDPATHHRHLLASPVTLIPYKSPWKWNAQTYSQVTGEDVLSPGCAVVNSVLGENVHLGPKAVASHCHLSSPIAVGKDSLLAGLTPGDLQNVQFAQLGDSLVVQGFYIKLPAMDSMHSNTLRALTVFGKYDNLTAPMPQRSSTVCNQPWVIFLNRTGITADELWDSHLPEHQRCLLTARLYPVLHISESVGLQDILWLQGQAEAGDAADAAMLAKWRSSWRLSLKEILDSIDHMAEFKWRRDLFFQFAQHLVRSSLLSKQALGLNCFYRSAAVEGYAQQMLETLDEVASTCGIRSEPGIAARTLANIADVLGWMSSGHGGMRSGPAGNRMWSRAFELLEKGDICGGVKALALERANWLSRPPLVIRAARHYEGAAQILIRQAVMTARQFINPTKCSLPAMGKWITGLCPARLDLSGGWSDTPPITYEHGGAVTNVAILLDGQKPIGAKIRRIPEPHIMLNLGAEGPHRQVLTLTELTEMADYSQPRAPGALLKCAFLCANIIDFPSKVSLQDQLLNKYEGGFELHTWANLPQGSGLGTSSILAGAIMAVMWRASGSNFKLKDLNHAVLHLEQMLTTGGGWQDQVGGLAPGVKTGHSKGQLPCLIDISPISMSDEQLSHLSCHLVLVYTGTTRLAKYLLQNVLRNWYSRDKVIVDTEDALVQLAWRCAKALEQGDWPGVGSCFDQYQEYKKVMAPGCEPVIVSHMMAALRPYIHGITMAGAGGGGFVYMLTKQPEMCDKVKEIIGSIQGCEGATVHTCAVDTTGLTVTVED